jgi:uncharacterized protein (DUF2062 family)/SAM-dependent methyltransferase
MDTSSGPRPSASGGAARHARRLVYTIRTEGAGPGRDAVAIGLGVFVGCLPVYGFHLALCWGLGWLLRLNRLKMYLAANISNPFVAPFLLLAELQVGAWSRRGDLHALTLASIRETDPWLFGSDLLVGSAIVGGLLGSVAGISTWLMTRRGGRDPLFTGLVRRASDRYVSTSITAWEFARGKLRGDPVYRMVVCSGILPPGGVLVDIGCGQGLMLALLAEAAADVARGSWPGEPRPPVFERLIGIESRPRVAALAQQALGSDATILAADARRGIPPGARAILLFDVLHLMPAPDQEALISAIAHGLDPGGVVLVREADAAAGWRFGAVRAGNRLKALAVGQWHQTFHFRTVAGWADAFDRAGFGVHVMSTGEGTPFGNVLFVLTREARGSA